MSGYDEVEDERRATPQATEGRSEGAGGTQHPLLALQGQIGNQAVGQLIQRKPTAPYVYSASESEADEEEKSGGSSPSGGGSEPEFYTYSASESEGAEEEKSGDSSPWGGTSEPEFYTYSASESEGAEEEKSGGSSPSGDGSEPEFYTYSASESEGVEAESVAEESKSDGPVVVSGETGGPAAFATKYAPKLAKSADENYAKENESSLPLARKIYESHEKGARRQLLQSVRDDLRAKHPGAEPAFIEKLAARRAANEDVRPFQDQRFAAGVDWSLEEVDRHIHRGEPIKVTYLGEDEREQYELKGNGSFTIGTAGVAADTSKMWSKGSGAGWGIFVMDSSGRIYAEAHKLAMFHHSSFTAGGAVAAAGEIRMASGRVTGITTKSGHYQPTAKDLVELFKELRERGVDLTSVQFSSYDGVPVPGGAAAYLAKHDPDDDDTSDDWSDDLSEDETSEDEAGEDAKDLAAELGLTPYEPDSAGDGGSSGSESTESEVEEKAETVYTL